MAQANKSHFAILTCCEVARTGSQVTPRPTSLFCGQFSCSSKNKGVGAKQLSKTVQGVKASKFLENLWITTKSIRNPAFCLSRSRVGKLEDPQGKWIPEDQSFIRRQERVLREITSKVRNRGLELCSSHLQICLWFRPMLPTAAHPCACP